MKEIVRPFFPPRPADAPPEPDYSKPGMLEELATRAGLDPESTFDSAWPHVYPDAEILGRALMAPAGIAVLIGPDASRRSRMRWCAGSPGSAVPTAATASRTRTAP